MNKDSYVAVACLQVPKVLFNHEKYRCLSNTAKLLYSLLLERLDFAPSNGWKDEAGNYFVIYPKRAMQKDLNCTRYRIDYAVQELEAMGDMIWVVGDSGKPNHFYINDITRKVLEEERDMQMVTLLEGMNPEDKIVFFDKLMEASKEMTEKIMDREHCDHAVQETHELSPMEKRGYWLDKEHLDRDQIEEDAGELGEVLALLIGQIWSEDVEGMIYARDFINEKYKELPKEAFMVVVETIMEIIGGDTAYIEDMYACAENKKARKIYLKETIRVFNGLLGMIIRKAVES